MKKIFIILTLFSLFNFTNIKAFEVVDENITKDEVIEEKLIPEDATPKENLVDEQVVTDLETLDQELMYTTAEVEEDDLIKSMSGTQNYAIYYVAVGVVVVLLVSIWLFIFSKARQMNRD